jgi:hypothetical protein
METRRISLKRTQANMMCPLLSADHQCVANGQQRIPIDRTDVKRRWRSAAAVGVLFLASDIASVRDGLSRRGFRWQSNRDYL